MSWKMTASSSARGPAPSRRKAARSGAWTAAWAAANAPCAERTCWPGTSDRAESSPGLRQGHTRVNVVKNSQALYCRAGSMWLPASHLLQLWASHLCTPPAKQEPLLSPAAVKS